MPIARALSAIFAASVIVHAAVPCAPAEGRNGSALCIALTIEKGRIAAKEFTFCPTAAYKSGAGQPFFQLAQREISKLAKPCDPLLAQSTAPAPAFCSQDSDWPAFAQAFIAVGPPPLLSEAGVFRPLVVAYHHQPLLFSGVNAESGIVTFQIPDPLDPRTSTTFQIEIRGAPNDDSRNRRIVQIRQTLNPLRNQVFCYDRIRARVQAFYKKLRIPIDIVQLDPQGPLLIIQEHP